MVTFSRGYPAILAKRNGAVFRGADKSFQRREGTSRGGGGTSFANTNKVPFFRHSVRLSPSDGALVRAYFRVAP